MSDLRRCKYDTIYEFALCMRQSAWKILPSRIRVKDSTYVAKWGRRYETKTPKCILLILSTPIPIFRASSNAKILIPTINFWQLIWLHICGEWNARTWSNKTHLPYYIFPPSKMMKNFWLDYALVCQQAAKNLCNFWCVFLCMFVYVLMFTMMISEKKLSKRGQSNGNRKAKRNMHTLVRRHD